MHMLIASPRKRRDPRGYDREGNLRFGMMLFLAGLAMFFVALIGAAIVFRKGLPEWPPAGLAGAPVGLSAIGTLCLLASSLFVWWAQRDVAAGRAAAPWNLLIALLLGLGFLGIQGTIYHWLYARGVTATIHLYGSVFFVMTGAHALHLLGGVVWLALTCVRAFRGRYTPEDRIGLDLCAMYWHFVDLAWLGLFAVIVLP